MKESSGLIDTLAPHFERAKIRVIRFCAVVGAGTTIIKIVDSSAGESFLLQAKQGLFISLFILASVCAIFVGKTPLEKFLIARKFYKKGCNAFENRKYDVAVNDFAEAIRFDPEWYFHRNFYGKSLLRVGEYRKSIVEFTSAIEYAITPANRQTAIGNRALANYFAGSYGESVNDYKEYLTREPTSGAKHRALAIALLAIDDSETDRAISEAQKALEIRKTREAYATLAVTLARAGKIEDARKEITRAEKFKDDTPRSTYALAQAYAAIREVDKAISRLNVAILRDSKFKYQSLADPLMKQVIQQNVDIGNLADLEIHVSDDSNNGED